MTTIFDQIGAVAVQTAADQKDYLTTIQIAHLGHALQAHPAARCGKDRFEPAGWCCRRLNDRLALGARLREGRQSHEGGRHKAVPPRSDHDRTHDQEHDQEGSS